MPTIKSHTDLEQSRKLAEILPLESADMWWNYYSVTTDFGTPQIIHLNTPWVGSFNWYNQPDNIPCWSLTALLNVASTYCNRLEITLRTNKKYNVFAVKGDFVFRSFDEFPDGIDNLIDCCYEVIIRLHELNLL